MKRFNLCFMFAIAIFHASFFFGSSFADQTPKPIATNDHIKEINYNPHSVHHYTGYYGYQSSIVFSEGETISTLSMGNSSGWQISPNGNRLFLKPIEENAETNVTIMTNKRVYHFAFHAAEAKGLDDPDLAYEVRFKYTDLNMNTTSGVGSVAGKDRSVSDISDAEYINFEYKIYGADYIKPLKVFDDGRFMYLEFRDINADLPAVFLVDSDGYEALTNFHIRGNYVVVERVSAMFTLRNGSDTVCVLNKKMLKASSLGSTIKSNNKSYKNKSMHK